MERCWSAISAIGGFAAIGLILDLTIRQSEEERLRDWMTGWWASFDSVKFSKFGRTEAERAIAIIDRWCGVSFWSWRRWRAVAVVVSFWSFVGFIWLSIAIGFFYRSAPYWTLFQSYWAIRYGPNSLYLGLSYVGDIVAFALSIAILRALAQAIARLEPKGVFGFGVFGGMLCVHGVLLIYWSLVVSWIITLFAAMLLDPSSLKFSFYIRRMYEIAVHLDAGQRIKDLVTPFTIPIQGHHDVPPSHFTSLGYNSIISLTKAGLDLTSNGLRIGFAVVFLSSYLFGGFLQPVVSRIWAGIIEKKKPVFATLFAILGGIWAFAGTLLK
jgi:hypothetical protein